MKAYPSTLQVIHKNAGRPREPFNSTLYMSKETPREARGTLLAITDTQRSYYMLKPEAGQMRCPNGAFGAAPTCSGAGCVQSYHDRLSKLHPQDQTTTMLDMISKRWKGVQNPYSQEDPIHQTPHNVDHAQIIPEGVIRSFTCTMTGMLMTTTQDTRNTLASFGGVRANTAETLQLVQNQSALSYLSASTPSWPFLPRCTFDILYG